MRDVVGRARACTLALLTCLPAAAAAQEVTVAPGEVTARIAAASDPSQQYALYLPTSYDGTRPHPVLFVLDPGGSALFALERFRPAAERHGWIVLSSWDTRSDGRVEPNVRALNAMLGDAQASFAIAPDRLYLAGFSGTARLAWEFAERLVGRVAGIIGAAAGTDPVRFGETRAPAPVPFYGTVGHLDFNHDEMRRFDRRLEAWGVPFRMRIFQGGHAWPPEPLAAESIDWLELQAMRAGLRPVDAAFVEEMHARDSAALAGLDVAASPIDALARARELAADYAGLRDTTHAAATWRALRDDPRVTAAITREDTLLAVAAEREAHLVAYMDSVRRTEQTPTPAQMLAALNVEALQAQAAGDGDEALSARRTLEQIFAAASFYAPRDLIAEGKAWHALALLDLANTLQPGRAFVLAQRDSALAALNRAAQPDTIRIRAGTLLDGRGAARSDVVITVAGGRIAAIEPADGRPVTHDLSAFTVLPGLIDTHVHINWHFDADGVTHDDRDETAEQAFVYAAANARTTLRAGITTVQSLGATVDGPLRDAIARGGTEGPRVITSLQSISDRTGPPEQIRARVRELKEAGADVIKIFASASIRDGGPATMSQEQLDAACGAATAVGLRSAVHAHGPESAQRAVRAGCTVIEHGALLDDATLDLMAEQRTFYDPNIGLVLQNYLDNRSKFEGVGNYDAEGFAHMERAVPLALDAFRRALRRPGIRIVFGTDAVAGAHGRNVEELIYRVREGGQDAMDAIVSATSRAAESLATDDSLGALAPGLLADLIAVRGNPAEEIAALRAVAFVMKGGEVVRNDVAASQDWPAYAGDAHATRWSPLTDLHPGNVARLEPAWSWRPGERVIEGPDGSVFARPGNFQATPVVIGDTMYLSTPFNQVVALEAATGRELWRHDPRAWEHGQPSNGTGFVHRGVAVWSDGSERRVFMNSRWKLIALDARTGRRIASFGDDGVVDLAADLLWDVERKHYTNTSPPVVWGDLVIVGNGVGDRLTYRNDPPGDVQAFDVRTGRRVWSFNPIPQPGELGNETWQDASWSRVGHTNVWAPFSVDTARGLVYLPVSTPSNDFYGGARLGDNLFAESIVCVDARTGERVWHFQTVHHGVWDYDLPAAPILVTITVDGRTIDAVAQPAKTGFVYVLDRVTGEPVWPIEELPVPQSDVPGERLSPTQPFPTRPAPISKQGFGPEDVIDFTPQVRRWALDALEGLRTGPLFTPPSREGTVVMPGLIGGVGWGGGAFDPATNTLYVKVTNSPALVRLIQPPHSDTIQAEWAFDRGASLRVQPPDGDTPDGRGVRLPSLPISKPPYGELVAIDMDTGEQRWRVPLGDTPSVREHPLLRHLDLPPLGVAGAPGPIGTAGGLLFATGGGATLYALSAADGRTLWQADLGASGYSVPATWRTRDGRQFVVIATGSGADTVLQAFALPEVNR